MALTYEGTCPLRVFVLIKEGIYGTSGENVLGGKDIIYEPVMSTFSWTILIQFFQSQVGCSPRAHS